MEVMPRLRRFLTDMKSIEIDVHFNRQASRGQSDIVSGRPQLISDGLVRMGYVMVWQEIAPAIKPDILSSILRCKRGEMISASCI